MDARETSEAAKVSFTTPYSQRSEHSIANRPKDLSTATAFLPKEGNMKGNIKIQCVYCGEYHYSASCAKVQSVDQRKGILQRDKRCFVCLQRGRECNRHNCRRCRGSHRQSVCSIDPFKEEIKEKFADHTCETPATKNDAPQPKRV